MAIKSRVSIIGLVLLVLVLFVVLIRLAPDLALLPGAELGNSKVRYSHGAQQFPRVIVDPVQREIEISQPPQRIVSGILSGDEMLSRLTSPQRIQSVTYLADDPGISNVSAVFDASISRNHGAIEEFIAAEPDLVIVAAYSNATSVEMLLGTGIPIIRFANFHTYQDIRNNLMTLAQALGEESNAEQWLTEMDDRIRAVRDKTRLLPRPRVLYYSLSGSTSGPGSLMDETIRLAGGRNVVAETGAKGYTRISPEIAISLLPDVILLSDWHSEDGRTAKDIITSDPAWQNVPAIENQRVYSLRGAWLTSGSPFRVRGVEEIARLLHPEEFADTAEDSS